MNSMYVDGDMFAADGGSVVRFTAGKTEGWAPRRRRTRSSVRRRTTASWRPSSPTRSDSARRRGLRLRPPERPDRRPGQGQRRLPGPVPARRRPDRLVGPARDVRHRRAPTRSRRPSSGCRRTASTSRPWSRCPTSRRRPPRAPPRHRSRARARPRRRRSRPRSPDPAAPPMIPLRDANPTRRTPFVTLAIIVACFVGFAWELGLLASGGEAALDRFITQWGVVPADLTAAWARGDYLSAETATLVTSQFLHGSWLHLLGNMLYLWIFGNNVEDRLGSAGFLRLLPRRRRAWPALAQVAIDPTSTSRRSAPRARSPRSSARTSCSSRGPGSRPLVFLGFFYQLIDVPAIIVLGFWFVLQLIDGIASLGRRPDGRRRVLRPHRRVRLRGAGRRAGHPGRRPSPLCRPPRRRGPAPPSAVPPPWDNPGAWTTGWSRWSSRASGSTCSRAATWSSSRRPTRDRYLPIWIGPWEASAIAMKLQGLTPERPLTHDLFATTLEELGRTRRAGRHLGARRRDLPRPALPRAGRPDRRGRRPAVRRAGPRGPGRRPDLRRASRSSTRPPWAATAGSARGDEGELGSTLDVDRGADRRPAARRLPRLRQLARRRTRRARAASELTARVARLARGRGSVTSRRGSAGRAGGRARGSTHIRSRSRQKSRTARSDDLRLGAGRRAGRPRVVRDADLDDRPARGAQLDEQLGREERAARFDPDALERLAPEELAGAVDVGDREPEEDPVGEPVGPRVERPDERVGALDPEADDDVGRVGLGQAGGQPAEVGDLELAVAVGEGDELVAGGPEPGAERRAVAEVGRVVDDPDDVRVARPPARRRCAGVASREPSSTAMISNVSASVGQRRRAPRSTRPSRLASSLWAGKKYDSRATRARRGPVGAAVGSPRTPRPSRHDPAPRSPMTRVRPTRRRRPRSRARSARRARRSRPGPTRMT